MKPSQNCYPCENVAILLLLSASGGEIEAVEGNFMFRQTVRGRNEESDSGNGTGQVVRMYPLRVLFICRDFPVRAMVFPYATNA